MMLKPRKLGANVRQSFSKIEAATEMPNLIEVQKDSYEWFLKEGLNEVLRDVSPIVDYTGNLSIEFTDYTIDPTPRYPVEECKDRSVTYDAHMKVGVRLVNKSTGELKTAQIFLGDFPLMTDNGTFVINGAERVIVSQLVRSPGMYYSDEVDKQGKHNYAATVIPYRGAWLEYETDAAGLFYVKIDKNRKIPISVLIRALCPEGQDNDDAIIEMFGDEPALTATMQKDECAALANENGTSFRDEVAYRLLIKDKDFPQYVLSDICKLSKGKTGIQKAISGEFPLVVTTTERKSCNTYQFDEPAVCIPLVSSRGHGVASLNHVYYQEGKFALGSILCGVTVKDKNLVSAKYLYYYFECTKDYTLVPLMKGGANVSMTVSDIAKVKVPIPSISEQKEIIAKLEVLDEYCNILLPTEIEARQKQYEYYRDKLLTFMPLP